MSFMFTGVENDFQWGMERVLKEERLAWPQHKDDTQIHSTFHISFKVAGILAVLFGHNTWNDTEKISMASVQG